MWSSSHTFQDCHIYFSVCLECCYLQVYFFQLIQICARSSLIRETFGDHHIYSRHIFFPYSAMFFFITFISTSCIHLFVICFSPFSLLKVKFDGSLVSLYFAYYCIPNNDFIKIRGMIFSVSLVN